MKVLSLFNGMNTGRQALENVGIKVNKYYSSEIKPYAIELTQHHFPDTIQVGDVTKWREWDIDWKSIDLVLSGSPCQDLSAADISAIYKGKSFKIEVKIGKDRMSAAQYKYKESVEKAGAYYIIARNFDDFIIDFKNILTQSNSK